MSIDILPPNSGDNSPIKRALKAVESMQAKLEAVERARREPIAIVGMGCRFPGGVHDAVSYWRLLDNGIDAITEVPPSRWDLTHYFAPDSSAPGKMYTRHGGFLDAIDRFDAPFFHISPKEARSLDPQQRLLLETAWEALENAAIAPLSLHGTSAGVFVGLCSNDYAQLLAQREEAEIDAYLATGTTHSMAAGRLSYLLGLDGPNLAVDTACSSGLAAVHLAMQSLRSGESDLALAGAANCILTPHYSINFCKARMLAPDGRCKTFAAAADGFVRGEGAGIVVLKRLSDAVRDENRILAVLRGSAINQDGHTSGPTVPSGPAQQAVIRRALQNAGLTPGDISYVEAHGTGTSLGDPIEAGALGAVFSQPLWVGSVKTNIGHLEGAAGIAGLLKVVLALQHRRIPANLHFSQPSTHIQWSELSLRVPTAPQPWETTAASRPRRAGISSFGFSGTNVHVVVEEAPEPVSAGVHAERYQHMLTLSARTPQALRELATSLLPFIEADLPNTAYTLNTGRSPFENRLAVIAGNGNEATARLRQFLDTGTAEGVLTGVVPEGVDALPAPANETDPVRLAELFVQGAVIDWAAWDRGYGRRKLALPTYPFQRRRHWYRDETPQAEDNLVYQVEWQPCSLPSLPNPAALADAITTPCACTQGNGALDSLEKLSAHYAARALQSVTAAEVAPNRRRLFDHLTAALTTSNLQPATAPYPEAAVERELLTRCGAKLPAILTGACDPLSLLFPESGGGLDRIYRDSPSSHSANRLAREAMERIVAGWPPERPLRILEVGAGTGGTTAHLLEILPPDRTEYVFTDVSRAFLKNARERFAAAPFVRYQALDIEKDPQPQGFPHHAYDVVLAANVLHATADLRTTLRHVRQLLAPGGLLLLLEVTRPQLWLDLTFGLLDGWWRFTDTDLRHGHPLLSPAQWQDLLAASAFGECAAIPASSDASLLRQDLIIARAASAHLIWRASSDNPEAACQDLLAVAQKADRPIWAALPDNGQAAPAAISALGRVIGLEHPTIWGGLVHVPPQAGEFEIAACIDRAAAANEKEIAFRDGQTLTPRLVRKSLPASAAQYRFRPDATYLITGGFGFLGLRLARWMASQGARNLVLVGRSGASSPEATTTLAALRTEGLQIEAVSADAAQPGAIASVIASITESRPPLRGVVHAAGRGGMEPVATLTATQLHDEFAPKNTAALALHEATLSLPLDFFILFSSASSIWGARGQAHYAAANACLDALAAARRRRNLPALSVNWGLLSGGGMISPEYRAWLTRAGVEPLEPENGFVSLFRLVTQPVSQAVIARVDWKKFAEVYEARQRTGLFDRMDRSEPATPQQPAVSWQDMPAGERRTTLLAFVQQQFCETLDLPPSEAPDPRHGFFDAGMDSLLAIEFKNRLQTGTGLTLPSTVAFNHPNCEALAAWLDHQIAPPQVKENKPAEEPASADAAEIARLFAGMQSFLQEEHQ